MFRSSSIARRVAVGAVSRSSSTPAAVPSCRRSLHHLAAAAAVTSPSNTGPRSHGLPTRGSLSNPHRQQQQQQQQIRTVFIQTENTPNPESIKFIPSGRVVLESEDGTGYFVQKSDTMDDILKSPLATQLFKIEGVKAVYLGSDFVTITKFAEQNWKLMRPEIFSTLMDFFDSNQAVLLEKPLITDTTILEDDDEIVAMIKELIEQRIRPAVQEDGGDIRYVSFEEHSGLVTVQLAGSCVGCPSSSITLKQGVENMLMHYIPEVKNVVALDEEPEQEDGSEAGDNEAAEVATTETKSQKSYEERLAAAGIPFSD